MEGAGHAHAYRCSISSFPYGLLIRVRCVPKINKAKVSGKTQSSTACKAEPEWVASHGVSGPLSEHAQGMGPRLDGMWCHRPGLQVQNYMEHHCSSSTYRRILLMFLDICTELARLCLRFEALHVGTPVTNNLLDKCKMLVSQSNDLSGLRAK